MFYVERYHDISAGHRVCGHESKCAHLHGHNYRVYFTVGVDATIRFEERLDDIGRVVDFSVVKTLLCEWLEREWDHKFLLWENDPLSEGLLTVDPEGIVLVPFNPTAENMAQYLVQVIGPEQLAGNPGIVLESVRIEETRKCSATYRKP